MKNILKPKKDLDQFQAEEKTIQSEGRIRRERYTPTHLRRNRKQFGRKELAILLIPMFAAVCAVVIVLAVANRGSSYRIEAEAFQYYGGSTTRIEKGAQLKRNKNGETLLEQSGRSEKTTLPVYLGSSRAIVIPTEMIYYAPRSNEYGCIACFSELECMTNATITVSREGNRIQPEQGFLYDGDDFYLFLEPMILSFNGYTMEVPALSYAEAVYGGYMMIFNYETKEFFIELSDGTGTAQPSSGDYVLSLIGDSLTMYDGTKILLPTRPDLFDPIV